MLSTEKANWPSFEEPERKRKQCVLKISSRIGLLDLFSVFIFSGVECTPATIHQCTGTLPYVFLPRYEYRMLNKLSWYLRYIYITNMGKHCLQLELPLLLFSPYVRRFSEQTDEKNPCWAVFSIIFKTRLVSCTDFWAHELDTRQYPSCFVVM